MTERDDTNERTARKLVEGTDLYYVENGLMVFTAVYLKRRGFCCGNDCRHCPYEGDKKVYNKNSSRSL